MTRRKVRILISGRVQGVFFRAFVRKNMKKLGVCGWVKNLPDGRVEAEFEGEAGKVNEMINLCRKGPRLARVDRLEEES